MVALVAVLSARLPSMEGRIIQSRSQESIVKEIKDIQEKVPGFTGVISDLGGPTANMYRLVVPAKRPKKPVVVYPVCSHRFAAT